MTQILVADDNEAFRRLVRQLLAEKENWTICGEAANGAEAVERAKSTRPDVAILDICMPKMNGIEAARQIMQACPDTAVLLMSTYCMPEVVRHIDQLGARGFISKSSMDSELAPAIEMALQDEPARSNSHHLKAVSNLGR